MRLLEKIQAGLASVLTPCQELFTEAFTEIKRMIDNHTICLNIETDLVDNATGLVVIDSMVNNTSSGGVRILENIAADEIKTLAREMTLKYSFIGLPRGGAKCGVKIPVGVSTKVKRKILEDFGRRLSPIIRAGIYYPGMDMNCGPEDLKAIYKGAGFTLGEVTDTSYFTAISVANAIYACREVCFEDTPHPNPLPQGERGKRTISIAIEGFGSVGSYLAERLPEDDYKIIAISTIKGALINDRGFSVEKLLRYRQNFGDDLVTEMPHGRVISKEEILIADVDILVPSARTWTINDSIARDIRARFVVPVANAPYTHEAIDILHDRGIICLPGFVTNSGGVFASGLYDSGVPTPEVERIANEHYRPVVAALLREAKRRGEPPVRLAERVAVSRLERKMRGVGQSGLGEKVLRKLAGRGLILRTVTARRAAARFVENLRLLLAEVGG